MLNSACSVAHHTHRRVVKGYRTEKKKKKKKIVVSKTDTRCLMSSVQLCHVKTCLQKIRQRGSHVVLSQWCIELLLNEVKEAIHICLNSFLFELVFAKYMFCSQLWLLCAGAEYCRGCKNNMMPPHAMFFFFCAPQLYLWVDHFG